MPASLPPLPHPALSRRTLLTGTAVGLGASLLSTHPATAATTPPSFIADYPTQRFSRYLLTYPTGVQEGVDYGIVTDPAGSGRRVAFFDNRRGLTHGTSSPRSAAETPRFVKPLSAGATTDEYFAFVSVYVPTAPAGVGPSNGLTLLTPAYGPPFGGASPLSLTVFPVSTTRVRVIFGPQSLLGPDFYLPLNTWWRVLLQFKFAYDGWVRMWIGTGLTSKTWTQVPLRGQTTYRMATMAAGVNDAIARDPRAQANSSRIGAYGWRHRVYYGHHVLSAGALPAGVR